MGKFKIQEFKIGNASLRRGAGDALAAARANRFLLRNKFHAPRTRARALSRDVAHGVREDEQPDHKRPYCIVDKIQFLLNVDVFLVVEAELLRGARGEGGETEEQHGDARSSKTNEGVGN